jgi:hypothetical protein
VVKPESEAKAEPAAPAAKPEGDVKAEVKAEAGAQAKPELANGITAVAAAAPAAAAPPAMQWGGMQLPAGMVQLAQAQAQLVQLQAQMAPQAGLPAAIAAAAAAAAAAVAAQQQQQRQMAAAGELSWPEMWLARAHRLRHYQVPPDPEQQGGWELAASTLEQFTVGRLVLRCASFAASCAVWLCRCKLLALQLCAWHRWHCQRSWSAL